MNKVLTITAATALLALGGCATQQQAHEHPELTSRIERAERAAAQAQQAAAAAQARAEEAAARAAANEQKIDRAFQRSQRK